MVVVAADEFEAGRGGASFKEFLLSAPDMDQLEIQRRSARAWSASAELLAEFTGIAPVARTELV